MDATDLRERLSCSVGDQLQALADDPVFQNSSEQLDLEAVIADFDEFTEHIAAYNVFHRRERRLWQLKIGRGEIPPDLEDRFRADIPEGRSHYSQAFAAMERVGERFAEAGFDEVLAERAGDLLSDALHPEHPLGDLTYGWAARVGCSRAMVEEFQGSFASIDYDLRGAYGSTFGELAEASREGVRAQIEILDHTEAEGFNYLRARCGPPAWAVTISNILAAAGIAISAWVVLAIVVALLALVAAICLTIPSHTIVGGWCRYVKVIFGLSF